MSDRDSTKLTDRRDERGAWSVLSSIAQGDHDSLARGRQGPSDRSRRRACAFDPRPPDAPDKQTRPVLALETREHNTHASSRRGHRPRREPGGCRARRIDCPTTRSYRRRWSSCAALATSGALGCASARYTSDTLWASLSARSDDASSGSHARERTYLLRSPSPRPRTQHATTLVCLDGVRAVRVRRVHGRVVL